jgi:hypothetical protein
MGICGENSPKMGIFLLTNGKGWLQMAKDGYNWQSCLPQGNAGILAFSLVL